MVRVTIQHVGWEAVCDSCEDCSAIYGEDEKHVVEAWARNHREFHRKLKEAKQ